jgi:c-di-GMP-binding flagellar brake protein YcgR
METANVTCLHTLARRHAGLVLSLPRDGRLHHYKSRFLDADRDSVWVECPASADGQLLAELAAAGGQVAVSFRYEGRRAMFAAAVLARETACSRSRSTHQPVAALRLKQPAEIRLAQRRAHYRAPVDGGTGMKVRIWRVGEAADPGAAPTPMQAVAVVRPIDLSVGGVGVLLEGADPQTAALSEGERVRVELDCAPGTVLLEGRVRRPPEPDAANAPLLRCGIQWVTGPDSAEPPHVLRQVARVVAMLERAHLRRTRGHLVGLR